MDMKRALVFAIAIMLGVGCGHAGVWLGGLPPYPKAPVLVDGDALRASMLDASLRDTQGWILAHYRFDLEADAVQGQSVSAGLCQGE
ncbi:MAG: hypothetical protein KAV87_50370 [Desulfobacteraceae bacterium]|nr:hypothetical protein [Desulfobacteraceae bacterium]